jgi:hypothetical protein
MRYCLSCRRLSANTPICTSCGASFGGSLCSNKKCRFLNPPQAQVCGKCGTTTLLNAASSLNLGFFVKILVWLIVLWLLVWFGQQIPARAMATFRSLTGFCDPLVWLIEKSAHGLIVIMTFHLISAFIPGEAGKMFRGLMNNFLNQLLKLAFTLAQKVIIGAGTSLVRALLPGKDTKT